MTDGDTLRFGDERIRLEAIDAPETAQPECLAERLLGEAATGRMEGLVAMPGPTWILRHAKDQYGRTLAVVTIARRRRRPATRRRGAMPWTGRQVDWCH